MEYNNEDIKDLKQNINLRLVVIDLINKNKTTMDIHKQTGLSISDIRKIKQNYLMLKKLTLEDFTVKFH